MERTTPANGLARYAETRGDLAQVTPETLELVLQGDLSRLTPRQRVEVYVARCEAAGLDYRTKPFDFITFQGKLTLYPNAVGAAQAADKRGINLQVVTREQIGDLLVVTCRGTTRDGRVLDRIGAVSVKGLQGEALANAMMKAETKANRRTVLALCGLASLDERDPDELPGAQRVAFNPTTGEVLDQPPVDLTSRVSGATEQSSTFASSAGAVLPTAEREMRERLQALRDEWAAQEFDPEDREGFVDYGERALGRKPAPNSDPAGRAADFQAILADFQDRKPALTAAMAAYKSLGGDPQDGERMREDMEMVFGYPFDSRRTRTAKELRLFADACKEQERRLGRAPELDQATAPPAAEEPPYDDPFADE